MPINLDIIIPCYNPPPDWYKKVVDAVNEIQTTLPNVVLHIILTNDGSSKSLASSAIDFLNQHITNFQYIEYPVNQGKGYALRQGAKAATHRYCIFTDIDFPYTLDSFVAIFRALVHDHVDIATGVRKANYYDNVPKVRVWISKFLKYGIRNFFSLPVDDTQCGLKGFNEKGKAVFLATTINRYLFDLEFIYMASKQQTLHIAPVHVTLKPNVIFSNMNWKILLHEGFNFMKLFLSKKS